MSAIRDISDIADIRHFLFERAEKWWVWSLLVAALVPTASIVSLWWSTEEWVSAAAILSIISPVLIVWMRELSVANQLKGDRCRRLILYSEGLGTAIAKEELAQVRASCLGARVKTAQFNAPYYMSNKKPGPNRLADITVESAFFTENLASKISNWLFMAFTAALACAVLILYLADFSTGESNDVVPVVAESVAIVIAFLIAGDFFVIAKKFGDLKYAAHDALIQCARLRNEAGVFADVVRNVVEDYGIALLQAPPIPNWVYRLYQDELNHIYRESHFAPEPVS